MSDDEQVFLRCKTTYVEVPGGNDTPPVTVTLDVRKVKWEKRGDGVYQAHAVATYACPSCDQVHEIRHHLEAPVLFLRNSLQCRTCGGPLTSSDELIEYSETTDEGPMVELSLKLMCEHCASSHREQFNMTVPDLTALRRAREVEVDAGELCVRPCAPASKEPLDRRFDVALSYSSVRRQYVRDVAQTLTVRLGMDRVFYDEYYAAELARPGLDSYLASIYRDDSRLLVVFLCGGYEKSQWCGLEWRVVRDLLKSRSESDVMLIRFEEVELPGLLSIDGCVNVSNRPPEAIAELIERRLEFERSRIAHHR